MTNRNQERARPWMVFLGRLSAYLAQFLALLMIAAGLGAAINGINRLVRAHDPIAAISPVLFEAPIIMSAIILFGYEVILSIRWLCSSFDKAMVVRNGEAKARRRP